MKNIYTILVALLTLTVANAKTYTVGSGKWNDASVWGGQYIGSTVKAGDVVLVTGQITMNTSLVIEGTLQVEKGAGIVGMKDLMIAKSGTFVNNGNTVVKRIINEGTINNNMIMEAMLDITNKSTIENNNNMVSGNNFENLAGNAAGKGGSYYVNNLVTGSTTAKFGNDVKVFYGSAVESSNVPSSTNINLDATFTANGVELTVSNASANVALYSIEKSIDGKNFTLIEMVATNNQATVSYTDTKTSNNLTYYRVKAINAAGEETVLPIASVKTSVTGYAMAN